jgi:hypothetical protein
MQDDVRFQTIVMEVNSQILEQRERIKELLDDV